MMSSDPSHGAVLGLRINSATISPQMDSSDPPTEVNTLDPPTLQQRPNFLPNDPTQFKSYNSADPPTEVAASTFKLKPNFAINLAVETDVATGGIINLDSAATTPKASEINVLKSDLFEIKSTGFTRTDNQFSNNGAASRSNANKPSLESLTSANLVEMGVLGKGASGVVLKVLHKPSLSVLALKVIDVADKNKRGQVLKELKELDSTESSPHIVDFYGAFYDSGQVKLALEYMNRGSLQFVLNQYGPLKESILQSIAKQSLLGLLHLHKNHKVHRDIKPGNMLVNYKGVVKLSDFGILAELASTLAKCDTFVGTTCKQQLSIQAAKQSCSVSHHE
jgi:hypothetical protein